MTETFKIEFYREELTPSEVDLADELVEVKYSRDEWNLNNMGEGG